MFFKAFRQEGGEKVVVAQEIDNEHPPRNFSVGKNVDIFQRKRGLLERA